MRRTGLLGVSFGAAAMGVLLAVLGTALVVSRASNERSQIDRGLATSAAENAALVDAELQRIQALALVTSRIPPFSELYADEGSQAAQIAAVAGPHREINDALQYLWRLYPDRLVEVGYVDVDGTENARVVNGVAVATDRLSRDVRGWPSYRLGVGTPPGTASISAPFMSPTAHVPVVATTVAVQIDDRVRAYVELELATSALDRVMAADRAPGIDLAVVIGSRATVAEAGPGGRPAGQPGVGTRSAGRWRVAVRPVPQTADWSVVASARSESPLALATQSTQAAVLVLAALMLALAAAGIRRSRTVAAGQFAAEQKARAEAERRSRTDPLTGLFNRRHTMETIDRELARTPGGPGLGVLMIDVDHFKRVNDRHGHSGGDLVLAEVARRLQHGVRDGGVVARIGGEEFCVLAPGLDSEEAVSVLGERLRRAVADQPVQLAGDGRITVTISVGAAVVAGGGASAEQAIDFADRALYAAKRHGRDRVRCFSELDPADLRAAQPECLHIAEALAITSDLREGNLAARSGRVAELAAAVGRRLGLSDEEILAVRLGGWLHDIGKIAIPDTILTKPGGLADREWQTMRTHSAVGADLIGHFPELAAASSAVRHHHEWFDGTGYPDRLAAEQIPLGARIVAAADVYCAMTSDRPYRSALTIDAAILELGRCAGTQLDPAVVVALVEVLHADATVAAAAG